ncbi:protein FAM177A1-like [Aulostomus maculatus]
MADLSLCRTDVSVSVGQDADGQQVGKPLDPVHARTHTGRMTRLSQSPARDLERVELGDLDQRDKVPRRIIHFSSGETMEEYSTDDDEDQDKERKDLLSSPLDAVRSKMTWGPYFWFHMWRAATSTISACEYLGERMASLFGITSHKYQYAIDEYYRMKKEREEENRLSEEAERSFYQLQPQEEDVEPISLENPSEDVTYQVQDESPSLSSAVVPAIITAT